MCDCINVELQSYDNQICVPIPYWMIDPSSSQEFICIDTCIYPEILELWKNGVETIGCCCGHNKVPAYIQVESSSVYTMYRLGYIDKTNEHGAIIFIPKSCNSNNHQAREVE